MALHRKPKVAAAAGAILLMLGVAPASRGIDLVGTAAAVAKDGGGSHSGSGSGGSSGSGGGSSGDTGGSAGGASSGSGSGNSGSGSGDRAGGGKGTPGDSSGDGDRHMRAEDRRQGDGLDLSYPDGFREQIRNGILELDDPSGRPVIKRPATAKDYARLRAHGA